MCLNEFLKSVIDDRSNFLQLHWQILILLYHQLMKEEEAFRIFYVCNQHLLHESIVKYSHVHTSQV